jgi:hypothetical protein
MTATRLQQDRKPRSAFKHGAPEAMPSDATIDSQPRVTCFVRHAAYPCTHACTRLYRGMLARKGTRRKNLPSSSFTRRMVMR